MKRKPTDTTLYGVPYSLAIRDPNKLLAMELTQEQADALLDAWHKAYPRVEEYKNRAFRELVATRVQLPIIWRPKLCS